MQDLKDMQKALKDSGILTSDEATVLMRILAGEQITPKMLTTLPSAIAKIVPNVIEKLVEEYLRLLDKKKELEDQLAKMSISETNEKEIYLQLISEDKVDEQKLHRLSVPAKNLVKTYLSTNDSYAKAKKKIKELSEDISKLTSYVKSIEAETSTPDRQTIADELLPLANAVANLTETINERVKNHLLATIEAGIKDGRYEGLSTEIIDMINRLIIRRLEEILKPYEDLSRQYVAGELTHEEFTEALKRNALLNHMREEVISDTIKALDEGRLDAPEIPARLRSSIQNLIRARNSSGGNGNVYAAPNVPIAGPSNTSGVF